MTFAEHIPILAGIFGLGFCAFFAAYYDQKRGLDGASFAMLVGTILIIAAIVLTIIWAMPVQHGQIIHRVVS